MPKKVNEKKQARKKARFSRGMPFNSLAISTYCLFCFLREISIVLLMKKSFFFIEAVKPLLLFSVIALRFNVIA